jgi:AhpD family alkylhydroperoxidase
MLSYYCSLQEAGFRLPCTNFLGITGFKYRMAHEGYGRPAVNIPGSGINRIETLMAHIELAEGLPGIRGPMVFSPETTKPLGDLVQVLLTGPHTLTPAKREMIATYVSSENDCFYCQTCHGSTAAQHLGGSDADYDLITQIKQNYEATPIFAKMKALLAISGKVQKGAST